MHLLMEFAVFLLGWSLTVLLLALLGDRVARFLRNTDRWSTVPRAVQGGAQQGLPTPGEPAAH